MSNVSPVYQKSIQNLKSLIFETLKGENVTVLLFGSRVRDDFIQVSDIDIGILPGENFDRKNSFY